MYISPELECVKFNFEQILEGEGSHLVHSIQQDYGEDGGGSGDGDFGG